MTRSAPLPPLERLLARGLLALLLLFAQQTATLHWLSHAIDATHAKAAQGSAPSEHCDECVALGALGAAAAPSTPVFLAPAGVDFWFAPTHDAVSREPLRLAFRSRAPPVRL